MDRCAIMGSSALVSLGSVARLRFAHTSGDRCDQREDREEPEARSGRERDRLQGIDHDDAHCNDLPKTVTVSGNYVRRAIEEPVNRIVEMVKENLPRPQLTSDISNREIVLVGGGSLLRGLEDKLRDEPGFPVRVAEVPTRCVAVGLGKILEGGLSTIRSAR